MAALSPAPSYMESIAVMGRDYLLPLVIGSSHFSFQKEMVLIYLFYCSRKMSFVI